MILQSDVLTVDIKVQDRYRKWFSSIGLSDTLAASCVILGDSDVDYNLAPNVEQTRVLNAPFNVAGVKHKLIYNGVGKNLSGQIKSFARKVITTGDVQSLYDYNLNENWSTGSLPPELINGKDWSKFTFDDTKMGYILYFSTVLDYYVTDDNVNQRLNEDYTFEVLWDNSTTTPTGWEYVIDNENDSMFLCKVDSSANPIGLNYRGKIVITGQFSKKVKTITFNY